MSKVASAAGAGLYFGETNGEREKKVSALLQVQQTLDYIFTVSTTSD